MTKEQRFKFEMFVRVRDFGLVHAALFPEASKGGQAFARVSSAVAEIDEHMKDHVLGRAEARKVKAATRGAVFEFLKTIAKAAADAGKTAEAEVAPAATNGTEPAAAPEKVPAKPKARTTKAAKAAAEPDAQDAAAAAPTVGAEAVETAPAKKKTRAKKAASDATADAAAVDDAS